MRAAPVRNDLNFELWNRGPCHSLSLSPRGHAGTRALRSGVLHGYREMDSDEMVICGRIRTGDQALSRNPLGVPLAVSFDDFTPDTPENRQLRAAARKLQQLPELKNDKNDVLGMLGEFDQQLSNVSPFRPGEDWRPTRLNAHYYRALNLLDLVLRSNSYELDGDSGVRTDGLLISMSQLYEGFVAVALHRVLDPDRGHCLTKQRHRLDDGGKLTVQTDLKYYASEGTIAARRDRRCEMLCPRWRQPV